MTDLRKPVKPIPMVKRPFKELLYLSVNHGWNKSRINRQLKKFDLAVDADKTKLYWELPEPTRVIFARLLKERKKNESK